MDHEVSFGAWLSRRRQALGLSRAELARRSACATVTLRKIEEDARRPSPELAALLAEHLAIPAIEHATFVRVARGRLPVGQLLTPTDLRLSGSLYAPLTPLVGRHAEWQKLTSRWEHSRAGHAQIVILRGEAGIGKTRLAEELVGYATAQGARTAQAQTYAAGDLAYAPLLAWLRAPMIHGSLKQLPDADQIELARLLPEILVARPTLSAPAALTEPWQRTRLFEALARAVLAARQPLLLILDDLQWCDRETLDWLHFVLRSATTAPILVLATLRAEDARANPLQSWWELLARQDQATAIDLDALDERETWALASQLAHDLSHADMHRLHQQSEGNPLFVVELTRAWHSAGAPEGAAGSQLDSGSASPGPLPQRIRAVLETRLSQLSPPARTLAEVAAVIGRAFTLELLVASAEDEDGAIDALEELWQRRIIRARGAGDYDFSHDKLREVTCASISPVRGRTLHRRAAEALLRVSHGASGAVSSDIAEHYRLAHMHEHAIRAYRQSADYAHSLGAIHESVRQLQCGVALLEHAQPPSARVQLALELQAELAAALMQSRGFSAPEVAQAYDRALELCQRAGRTAERFPLLWGLHEVFLFQARGPQARAIAEQLLATAEELQDPDLILQGNHAMWGVLYHLFADDLQLTVAYAERGLAQYDAQRHRSHILPFGGHDAGICCRQTLMRTYWLLGHPDRARSLVAETLMLGERQEHPFSHAMALDTIAMLYHFMDDAALVDRFATLSLDVALTHQYTLIGAEAHILQAWARAKQGAVGDWIGQARDGIAAWNGAGAILQQTYHQQVLAEICLLLGDPGAALVASQAALTIGRACGEGLREAEAHRIHGVALLAVGAPDEHAEESYQQALAAARRQGARSLELRAAVSMVRLWRSQGRHADAHQLLAPIYAWFTEGFDTSDLIDAQALLRELTADMTEAT